MPGSLNSAAKSASRPVEAPPRLAVVCQVYYPDAQSTSQLLAELLPEIGRNGTAVTILTGFPFGTRASPPKRETIAGVDVRRTGLRFLDYRAGVVRRALHYGCYLLGCTLQLCRLPRGTLVLGVTNPPFLPVWLWLVSRLRGSRYSLMLQDIYPDGLEAVGRLAPGGVVATAWRSANRRAFARACHILVLGRDMAERVSTRYGVPQHRIGYFPHWSLSGVRPEIEPADTALHRRLELGEKFIVQYSGNMGLWHDIDGIVDAAALLRKREDVIFLLIGAGLRRRSAQERADRLGLRNLIWLEYQPRETLADSLACCHVALVSQRPGLAGVAVPCKIYGILAAGRPVVAMVPAGSEIDRVISEESCGITIQPGDGDGLAAAIVRLKEDRGELLRMGAAARRAAKEKYTLDRATQRFLASLALQP